MSEPERHYTTSEVAEQFQVSPRTVAVWIKTGILSGIKPGGKNWRISQSEVTRLANKLYGDGSATADEH